MAVGKENSSLLSLQKCEHLCLVSIALTCPNKIVYSRVQDAEWISIAITTHPSTELKCGKLVSTNLVHRTRLKNHAAEKIHQDPTEMHSYFLTDSSFARLRKASVCIIRKQLAVLGQNPEMK